MVPPRWLDDHGRPRPTYACARCGSLSPRHRYELSTLRMLKWQLGSVVTIVSWCGHGTDHAILPAEDGWAVLVPVLGEAT